MYPATRCCRGACVQQQHPSAAAKARAPQWPWQRPAAAPQTSAAACLVANLYLNTYWNHASVPSMKLGCRSNAHVCSPILLKAGVLCTCSYPMTS